MEEHQVTALAKKAKAGDVEAFEKLYAEHVQSILFHVRSLIIDKQSYTDVAQDVALEMFKHIQQLREPAAFRGWMHQIVRAVCVDHNRKYLNAKKRTAAIDDDDSLEAIEDEGTDFDPEASTMANMEGNWLYVMVSELPRLYREIIIQFYYDGMSYKEIAEAQGISVTNASTRLQRAMKAIRKKIGEGEEQNAQNRDTKETSMHADDTHIPNSDDELTLNTDGNLEGKGLQDDIGMRNSLVAAAAMLASDDTTQAVLDSVHTKVLSLSAASAGTSALVQKVPVVIGTVIGVVALVCAAVAGVFFFTQNDTPPAAPVVQEVTESQTIYYEGTLHIIFTDAGGEDSDRNIVSATVTEDEPISTMSTWQLYKLASGGDDAGDADVTAEANTSAENTVSTEGITVPEDATPIQVGSGYTIDNTVLGELEPGVYQIIFSLTDSEGALAQITRTFTVTG